MRNNSAEYVSSIMELSLVQYQRVFGCMGVVLTCRCVVFNPVVGFHAYTLDIRLLNMPDHRRGEGIHFVSARRTKSLA